VQTDEYRKMREQEDRYWWFVARRQLALALLDRYGCPLPKILDLGSGTGAVLNELQTHGWAVGVDFSPHALAFSKERGLQLLVQGDAEHLPFLDASFDVVVTLDTIEHVRNDARAITEVFRVLKPGGILIMNVPAYRWLWGPHDVALMHFRRYTKGQVSTLLRSAGFGIERLSYSVFFLFPVVVAIRVAERLRSGPAQVRLPQVSARLNSWLLRLMALEGKIVMAASLPFGSSLVAVARRPAEPDSSA